MLIPKILQLRNKLSLIRDGNLVYTKPLASNILNGLSSSFADLFNFDSPSAKDAILAAVSCPQYIMRCVPPDRREAVSASFALTVVDLAAADLHTLATALSDVNTAVWTQTDDYYWYGPGQWLRGCLGCQLSRKCGQNQYYALS